jgi:Protein of unknown function DUF262/Protein of unknown function (DUF1524)
MSQLLYTVEEVFAPDGYLHANNKAYYNIPLYQRGYKWEPASIKKLLQDIYDFKERDGKFYCLQNITLVPKDGYFNVVDGQQRLATLTLILSYLGNYKTVQQKVRFPDNSIRQETNRFINSLITVPLPRFESSWPEFIARFTKYDHQDIFYLFHGYRAIEEWFNGHVGVKSEMMYKLLQDVKFIVNNIESSASEGKIFVNLNSKRVPLDGADLLRAMIITRVAQEAGEAESNVKAIVKINERRMKIGAELDQISQWWGHVSVKDYYRKFINIKSDEPVTGTKLFNDDQYPINLLYLLFAEKEGKHLLALEDFEKRSDEMLVFYAELLKLHYTLQDWKQDKKIYHYLGYLFSNQPPNSFNFKKAWEMWENAGTRNQFIIDLNNRIKETIIIDGQLPDFTDTTQNWYEKNKERLIRTLILMDIIYALRDDHANMPIKAFSRTESDIEHIFPQNPADIKQKKEYINFLNQYIVKKNHAKFDLSDFDNRQEDEDYKTKVEAFIDSHTSTYRIHAIGNLVLLASSLNRSIKNKPYAYKRSRVVRFYQDGNYIQPHTFQVFTRYNNDPDDKNFDLMHWTNLDIDANSVFINEKIKRFFNLK